MARTASGGAAKAAAMAALALSLGACAVPLPSGPTVAIMPGQNKNWDAFRADDLECRQYAQSLVTPADAAAASRSSNATAILGTVFGGALGALFGVASGNPAAGAAIGAGSGAILGTANGAGIAGSSAAGLQGQYNLGYTQCMVAKGNSVPSTTAWAPFRPVYQYWRGYPYYYPYW
jgi:hypothetical protein